MKFLLGLAALSSAALAQITFNVVGYRSAPTNSFGVSIDGTITKLNADETTFPVWTGVVPTATSAVQYAYVELNAANVVVKTEPFVRKLINATHTRTENEFFERQTTTWELPKLPYTYLATYPSKTKAFKQKQIATIHITGSAAEMTEMNTNPKGDKDYRVTFRFINADTIYTQNNITLQTAGKSSKEHSKQSFKFKFDTDYNQTFFSRPNIKLRSMVQDPTMIREKLYIDVLNSVGIPTQQGAWVRLFVNNKPYGLYLMVDDIKKSFPQADCPMLVIPLLPRGPVCRSGLQRPPTSADYCPFCYTVQNEGLSPITEPLQELIAFMKDLQDFNPTTNPDPIGYWNNTRLDLDGFLRSMALEYLMGGFDMYWMSGSNYFMYRNPSFGPAGNGGKWQWIPTDMDGTFGSGYPTSTLPSYKNNTNFAVRGQRPLVQKLILENPQINAKFEEILKEIVSTVFKPEAMNPRAQAYHRMLSADAKWDTSLIRQSPGLINNNFTFEDFNNNLNQVTKNMQSGVLPWIASASALVAKDLGFTIPAGVVDRVPPPPKKGDQGNPEDEEDDVPGGADGQGGNGGNSGGGSNSATGHVAMGAAMLQVVVVSSLALGLLL
ncbi:MAG: coth protein-domain-containing protein [Linnemannia elongata]|nr:MAG: coth protein-domain-containing protein [Linnemannia elongata]